MQRSYSIRPHVAKKFDLLLDELGFVWEISDTRTRYAMRDFIVALTEGEVIVDQGKKKATMTIDIPS